MYYYIATQFTNEFIISSHKVLLFTTSQHLNSHQRL